MPIYVYGCDTCGNRFEKKQGFQDAPLEICPKCEAKVRRIMQPAGIVFKGSGWHSTDYRAKSASSDAADTEPKPAADKAETKGKAESDSAKTEPKPAESSAPTTSTPA
ncbi:MAG: zinc ribbon domain-containing protein [Herpetosiphon sp.]